MKKAISLLFLMLVSGCIFAQTYDSLCHHSLGWYDIDLRNKMEMRDGSLLGNCQMFNVDASGQYINDYGNRLLKITSQQNQLMSVVDSTFINDEDLTSYLFCQNHLGDDNIYAHIIRDQESQQSALEVKFFDDNLIFTDGFELPLENHVITASNQGFLLDKNNDIILEYHSWGLTVCAISPELALTVHSNTNMASA